MFLYLLQSMSCHCHKSHAENAKNTKSVTNTHSVRKRATYRQRGRQQGSGLRETHAYSVNPTEKRLTIALSASTPVYTRSSRKEVDFVSRSKYTSDNWRPKSTSEYKVLYAVQAKHRQDTIQECLCQSGKRRILRHVSSQSASSESRSGASTPTTCSGTTLSSMLCCAKNKRLLEPHVSFPTLAPN